MDLEKFNYVFLDKEDDLFYPLLGDVISDKEIAELLGRPLWNDDNKLWFVAFTKIRPELAGCSAIVIEGDTAYFKSSYVKPQYRGEGIYSYLFQKRMEFVEKHTPCKEIRASATEMSKSKYEKEGFEFIGMEEEEYYLFRKEV